MANILIVDDEQSYRQLLTLVFQTDGHSVRTAMNGRQALELLDQWAADVIVSDIRMPDLGGLEMLRILRESQPDIGVVFVTAVKEVDTAREAFKLGADDFITKPYDVEELKLIVKKTLEKQALIVENQAFKRAQRDRGSIKNIVGTSAKMDAVFQMIETVAEVQSTVLITGESGTGKELVARAIHDQSPRGDKPFISINCGAFTETLLESELFGYIKGAFTGANTNRKGLFEAADSGTIFLDEIGEMSPAMQVKLLRVLQERRVRPVGGHEEIPVDARVIAATNRNLKQMSQDGTFREDLFYRISVIPIDLPPLRERAEDIPELVEHFLKKFGDQTGKHLTIAPKTMQLLESYAWHGNVRELEHTIERAVALERGEQIQPEQLPDHITHYNPARIKAEFDLPDEGINLVSHLESLEKAYVVEALRRSSGNQTKAAELLQMPVRSVRHLLDKHDIRSLSAQMRSAD
jgi:two-component system, NtrC family, response regulator PilR